ncbi:uncharacterized protein KY384_003994 [Bacidia gigantensis]|uniref:uncharacterized protein n=1 Tax=Bacidia gigantensis TaxID=2732470 RepID=UPI001D03A5B6|nr:uncharacterized protein KY384_003994 [Bacidia gigantensis]KAG8531283.1 hypothetical protein KY384_003994 [Bacidia gigantensis]
MTLVAPSHEGLVILTWTFTGACIVFSIGRYIIRYKKVGRFCLDDVAHAVALLGLVGFVGTYVQIFPYIFQLCDYLDGKPFKKSGPDYQTVLQLRVAVAILFWLCIYGVKFAFLFLYRMLFVVSNRSRNGKIWWSIAGFTSITFFVCVFGTLTMCGPVRYVADSAHCDSVRSGRDSLTVIEYTTTLHIVSDLIIMAFPLFVLKDLRIKKRQNVGLSCLFCLATLIVIFDVLRTAFAVIPSEHGAVIILATTCDILEASVAVIVSSLPVYGTLLVSNRPQIAKGPHWPSNSRQKMLESSTIIKKSADQDPEYDTARLESDI